MKYITKMGPTDYFISDTKDSDGLWYEISDEVAGLLLSDLAFGKFARSETSLLTTFLEDDKD